MSNSNIDYEYMIYLIDKEYDYIVVGAGITGITLANKLADYGRVILIEKEDHVGGLCYDCNDNRGVLIHPHGPHIFHTDNQEVYDYLSNFTYWNNYIHKTIRIIDDKDVPMPFNLISLEICLEDKVDDITSMLLQEYDVNDRLTLKQLRQSSREEIRKFGDYLYDNILEPYYSKIYKEYTGEVLDLSNECVFKLSYDCRFFPEAHQALPTEGYSKMFEKMLDHENITVLLNTDFKDIMTFERGGEVYLNNGRTFNGTIFFTARIDRLFEEEDNPQLHYTTAGYLNEHVDHVRFQEIPVTERVDNKYLTRTVEYKFMTNQHIPYTTVQFEFPGKIDEGFPDFTPYYPVRTQKNIDKHARIVQDNLSYTQVRFMGRLGWFENVSIAESVERTLNILKEEYGIE